MAGPSVDRFSILILLVIVSFVAGVIITFRRKGHPYADASSTKPCCGHCGYAVEGLPTFICPECGSDLREVGIAAAAQQVNYNRIVKTLSLMVLWSIGMLVAGAIGVKGLDMLQTYGLINYGRVTYLGSSGNYNYFGCTYDCAADPTRQSSNHSIELFVNRGGMEQHIEIDSRDLSYVATDLKGQEVGSGPTITEAAVLEWMAAAGINTDDLGVEAAVVHIVGELPKLSQGQHVGNHSLTGGGNFGGSGMYGTSTRWPYSQSGGVRRIPLQVWIVPAQSVTVIGCVLLWAIGMWRLVKGEPLLPMRRKGKVAFYR